jgi:hypothetical protein
VVHLVRSTSRGCGQSVQECSRRSHVLVGPGEGKALRPLAVNGGGNVPSLSSGIGEVNHYGPLCLEHGLVVVQFDQLSLNGHSLTDEFTSLLCSPALSGGLSSVGSRLLLLLIDL